MLKEIDLIAFGRRVHIFNAIKELKSRITTSSSSPDLSAQPVFSPTPSGYDADPGTPMSFASPATTGRPSFASIPPTPTTLDHATLPLESPRGLGFVGAGMTPPAAKVSADRFSEFRSSLLIPVSRAILVKSSSSANRHGGNDVR